VSEGERVERDSMGEVLVAGDALWGAATQRAIENFPISALRVDGEVIAALAEIKGAAADVNERLGVLDRDRARAIVEVATEIAGGRFGDQFPVDVFQTGSGTSTNMNMNEVIAHLASRRAGVPVHPNDHVNASQSSNDAFPSAVHVAVARAVAGELLPAAAHLTAVCERKAAEFATVVKAGRTHLMDAAPVMLGQELGGYAAQLRAASERLNAALATVLELPLGGTAVGTGLNAPAGFAESVIDLLQARTGLGFVEAPNHFAAQGGRDALVGLSGDCRVLGVVLFKIANDVRWMASGPSAGLAEITVPALQPGSSIMPGKVNPVLCESVLQVVAQVIGNDATVGFAGSQGSFELNTFVPVMARNILESVRLLTTVAGVFADRCVGGIVADVEACRRYAEGSPAVATALTLQFGYDVATEVVKEALAQGRTVRDIVVERGLLDRTSADELLEPRRLAGRGELT
jgi:fumarate hydratase, class II